MGRELELERLYTFLEEADYPCSVSEAADRFDDVTLLLADGQTNLGSLIAESTSEQFASADELGNEVMMLLPRYAVGEPYQSEGEG